MYDKLIIREASTWYVAHQFTLTMTMAQEIYHFILNCGMGSRWRQTLNEAWKPLSMSHLGAARNYCSSYSVSPPEADKGAASG
jgi:hypothetical protein